MVAASGWKGVVWAWSQAQAASPIRASTSTVEGTPATHPLPWFCMWEIPVSATCQARNHPILPQEDLSRGCVQPQNLLETQFTTAGML